MMRNDVRRCDGSTGATYLDAELLLSSADFFVFFVPPAQQRPVHVVVPVLAGGGHTARQCKQSAAGAG